MCHEIALRAVGQLASLPANPKADSGTAEPCEPRPRTSHGRASGDKPPPSSGAGSFRGGARRRPLDARGVLPARRRPPPKKHAMRRHLPVLPPAVHATRRADETHRTRRMRNLVVALGFGPGSGGSGGRSAFAGEAAPEEGAYSSCGHLCGFRRPLHAWPGRRLAARLADVSADSTSPGTARSSRLTRCARA